jgi:mannose-6-phosphate isomerase
VRPLALPPNVLPHFYAGGARLAAFRGLTLDSDHMPEEWIGSVTTAFGEEEKGLSRLADGTLLRDAIADDQEAYLGPGRTHPGLLVKLLDAGERLPVHFHPGREFARAHLGSEYGKTEAWIILEAEPGATVHVGFTREVSDEELRGGAALLDALNEIPVAPGDALFVPAGVPHALGAGILLVELQEPTDFSLMLEWEGFPLSAEQAHLGLGFDRALEALERRPLEPQRLTPEASASFFRAERLTGAFDAGFSILVVTDGEGVLATEGGDLEVARGATVLLPHAAGAGELRGAAEAIRCRPPA